VRDERGCECAGEEDGHEGTIYASHREICLVIGGTGGPLSTAIEGAHLDRVAHVVIIVSFASICSDLRPAALRLRREEYGNAICGEELGFRTSCI
jgi:hypothetical protein